MRGFTLVEMLVSLLIVLVVALAMFRLMNSVQALFVVQAELPDMQQRLRAGADALSRDLLVAGAGPFPSIVPHRRGWASPDVPGTFRRDRVSVLYVPASAPQARVSDPTDGAGTVRVAPRPRCPAGDPLCGFLPDMLVVIFDDTGAYDTFRVSGLQSDPPALLHAGFSLSKTYSAGATVAQAEAATYWLQVDPRSNVSQLMKYDGRQTDLPLADNVVDLQFEYRDEAQARLDPGALSDGPWLPDSTFPHRFDADLLRVRQVQATIRVRPNYTLLHAPVTDRTVHLAIAPRAHGFLP
jgi:prepilin-type N-terminal cleavage/methylation domain-containing protein